MRVVLGVGSLIVLCGAVELAAQQRAPEPEMTPAAREYLNAALDTIQAVTLGADTIPWAAVRDSAHLMAWGARTPSDSYGAVQWALGRANRHSFLQASAPGVVTEVVDGRFGYVRVPQRGGAAVALADSLHEGVGRGTEAGACGWIVDLRGNGGGNMWPMLAGVGPLLGDTLVGVFDVRGEEPSGWFYRGGVSGVVASDGAVDTASVVTVTPVPPVAPDVPVAVLIDARTGSSGEALAVAFHGRPNTRLFGAETAGYATVNRGSSLPDGANMVVTTGYYGNRHGRLFPGSVRPDTVVPTGVPGWPFATDRTATVAREWLAGHPSCR